VNRDLLDDSPTKTSPGKEPTNSFDFMTSIFVSSNRIMAKEVIAQPNLFQYMKPAVR